MNDEPSQSHGGGLPEGFVTDATVYRDHCRVPKPEGWFVSSLPGITDEARISEIECLVLVPTLDPGDEVVPNIVIRSGYVPYACAPMAFGQGYLSSDLPGWEMLEQYSYDGKYNGTVVSCLSFLSCFVIEGYRFLSRSELLQWKAQERTFHISVTGTWGDVFVDTGQRIQYALENISLRL